MGIRRLNVVVVIVVFIGLMVLSGCAVSQKEKTIGRSIVDMAGTSVALPEKVNRVAATGAVNQIVLMLGGADKIVATATNVQENELFAKVYPHIKEIPAPFGVMDAGRSEVNVETLVATKPDVVFANNDKIRAMGIPTVETSLKNPEEIKQTIMVIGKVLGPEEEKRAIQFCTYYDDNMKKVSERTKTIAANKKVKVYYANNKPTNTDGMNSIANSWIEMAGGINVAGEAGVDGVGKNVSGEDLVRWNPDVIIVSNSSVKNAILQNDQWGNINAVKNKRIYVNPKGVYLWSVRSAEGALQFLWAGKMIQPEWFADLDLKEQVRNFYKMYYFYDINDAEIDKILDPD